MALTDGAAKDRPRVAVSLQSSGNTRLIHEILGDRDVVGGDIALDEAGEPAFDLAIVDAAEVVRSREFLRRCRGLVEPVILPVLVVVDRGSETGRMTRELGVTADDVVRIPTTREELVTRIDNLLRLRALSRNALDLHTRYERVSLELEGANRALRTLNAGNEVLVRAGEEGELLRQICRVIVESEDYEIAWAGFRRDGEDEDDEIAIEVAAGEKAGYAEGLRLRRSRFGGAPAWRAMETGGAIVVEDILRESSLGELRDSLQQWGLSSGIALPLRPESGAPGVLAIYSGTQDTFHDNERELLMRLATNTAFGLNALRVAEERDRTNEAIHDLAYNDPLTGLYNRNALAERLDSLLSEGGTNQKGAVLFVDLDRFKIINDALGHGVGDMVLQQIAGRLQQLVRPEDLVARQGGDEFIVVMADSPRSTERGQPALGADTVKAAGRALAERIATRLRDPVIVDGTAHNVEASIGISFYPEHATTADELIDRADAAMYTAKKMQGHVCTYSELIPQQRYQRLSMEARLRDALETGEFRLHYQPQFNLDSGAIEGVEALIRWPQSDGSQLSPAEFIPVAEESGLIVPLGEWVLRTAIEQRLAWLADGHDLMMSVNASIRQLQEKEAIRRTMTAISSAYDPARIELEVTESDLMQGGDESIRTIETLNERGFRIAIDDFGTGYSSLSRLQEMPINTLKIDQSFVAGLEGAGRQAAIAHTIQRLAENIGRRTVAEGVETNGQRRKLLEIGCSIGQGFLVSAAVPPDEVIRMLDHRFSDARDTESG